jgi:hypothetical protein
MIQGTPGIRLSKEVRASTNAAASVIAENVVAMSSGQASFDVTA